MVEQAGGVWFGYMSFRPTPFKPLQFQPFTLSTAGLFDRLQIQPPQIRPI